MYSQAVTHPSTNMAQCCLTSVIRRELVFSTWYGCRQMRVTHLTWSFTFWGLKLLVPFIWIAVQVSTVLVVYRTKQSKLDSLLKEVCIHYNSPRTVISSGSMKVLSTSSCYLLCRHPKSNWMFFFVTWIFSTKFHLFLSNTKWLFFGCMKSNFMAQSLS